MIDPIAHCSLYKFRAGPTLAGHALAGWPHNAAALHSGAAVLRRAAAAVAGRRGAACHFQRAADLPLGGAPGFFPFESTCATLPLFGCGHAPCITKFHTPGAANNEGHAVMHPSNIGNAARMFCMLHFVSFKVHAVSKGGGGATGEGEHSGS